jgi:predicted membrane metal-binding protein
LVVGVLLDVLYGVPSTSFIKSFPFSLGFSFLFLISFWAREKKLPGARDVRRTVREYVERLMAEVVIKKTIKPVYELAVKQDRLLVK